MGEKAAAGLGVLLGLVGVAIPITSALSNISHNPYFEVSREPFEYVKKIKDTLNLLERDKKQLSAPNPNYPQYIPDRAQDEIETLYHAEASVARISALEKSVSVVREDLAVAEKHPSILAYNLASEEYFFNPQAPHSILIRTCFFELVGAIGGYLIGMKSSKKPSQQLPSYRLSHCDGGPKA